MKKIKSLICGDRFGKLERTKMPDDLILWIALESYPHTIPIVHGQDIPEESVANLYLNKKIK